LDYLSTHDWSANIDIDTTFNRIVRIPKGYQTTIKGASTLLACRRLD
jgi:hypothetical protein